MDNSNVALDVDMWCPDVVVVVSYWCVCVCVCVCVWRGVLLLGGDVCVSQDAFEV